MSGKGDIDKMKGQRLKWILSFVLFLILFSPSAYAQDVEHVAIPITGVIGALCTMTDQDFPEFRYKEQIPYCTRNATYQEKVRIAKRYHIPRPQWHKYEFDHLIPLSTGGSNSERSIWMQPIEQAHIKDKIEYQVYIALKKGKITRAEGVKALNNWFCEPSKGLNGEDLCETIKIIGLSEMSVHGLRGINDYGITS